MTSKKNRCLEPSSPLATTTARESPGKKVLLTIEESASLPYLKEAGALPSEKKLFCDAAATPRGADDVENAAPSDGAPLIRGAETLEAHSEEAASEQIPRFSTETTELVMGMGKCGTSIITEDVHEASKPNTSELEFKQQMEVPTSEPIHRDIQETQTAASQPVDVANLGTIDVAGDADTKRPAPFTGRRLDRAAARGIADTTALGNAFQEEMKQALMRRKAILAQQMGTEEDEVVPPAPTVSDDGEPVGVADGKEEAETAPHYENWLFEVNQGVERWVRLHGLLRAWLDISQHCGHCYTVYVHFWK